MAERTCVICGEQLPPRRRRQCGDPECLRQYNNLRQREFYTRWQQEHGERYNARYPYDQDRKGAWRAKDPERANAHWRKDRARRRAIERGAQAEDFTHEEIFDRDNWRCGLCGQQIAKNDSYPNPRSASLDHIVPLAEGGQHTRPNVQAAHLTCNLSKNAGVHGNGEQLRVV